MSRLQQYKSTSDDQETPTDPVFSTCAALLSYTAQQIEKTATTPHSESDLGVDLQNCDLIAQVVQCIADVIGAQRIEDDTLANIPLETVSTLLCRAKQYNKPATPDEIQQIFSPRNSDLGAEIW